MTNPTPPGTAYDFDGTAVRVATTGSLMYVDDPSGTKYPTLQKSIEDPTKNLIDPANGGFAHLGFLTDDAVEHEFKDSTEDISSWQGGVVRTVIKARDASFKLSSLETNRPTLELFYGAPVVKVASSAVYKLSVGARVARRRMITVFEFRDGVLSDGTTERVYRIILPASQVTDLESPKFKSSDAVEWGITIKALGTANDLVTLISNDELLAPKTS
ncbi:phage tail tube protein [Kutzneria chonburiensis]|uniref:Phage tail protein n=1 Tax=Kutzneria chonburiensis TaxID=1483604 RepID=A0ABV6N368_9PSEU|nr:hypothetical protein [Kutzneria chonburiensis]